MSAPSHWDEQEGHPVEDWRAEVMNDDTRLGYLDWCNARRDELADDILEETDPYGLLEYAVGAEDDFICFDFAIDHERGLVRLHAVVNSETGHFIQDFGPPVTVPLDAAAENAEAMVDAALQWCTENNIQHDRDGWNQEPHKFCEAVCAAIGGGS